MSRSITIPTPENIAVTYEVAGVASRFLATLIDLVIQLVICLFGFMIYRLASSVLLVFGDIFGGLFIVYYTLVIFAYSVFFEVLWGGRTPGKRLLGLRVIRDGGYPINFMASLLRNLLKFLDFGILPLATPLVLCGLPGLICIFFSPNYKRIGDYAAGTLVIHEPGVSPFQFRKKKKRGGSSFTQSRLNTWNPSSGALPTFATLNPQVTAMLPLVKNLDRLSLQEYQAVRRFKERRSTLDLQVQAGLGEYLGRRLMDKLEIQIPIVYQLQFADVLEAIEHRYAEENGVL